MEIAVTAQQETTVKHHLRLKAGPLEFDGPGLPALIALGVIFLLLLFLLLFFPAQIKTAFTTIHDLYSHPTSVLGGNSSSGVPGGNSSSGVPGGNSSSSVSGGGSGTLSAADTITALRSINVDFSVERKNLEEWLGNPEFTPYPAIASALLTLVKGGKLRDLVFIDVIVYNYEHTPGVNSPRTASDVRVDALKAAVLEGYNSRHEPSESSFDAIVT
jgi:hypothetical protein